MDIESIKSYLEPILGDALLFPGGEESIRLFPCKWEQLLRSHSYVRSPRPRLFRIPNRSSVRCK